MSDFATEKIPPRKALRLFWLWNVLGILCFSRVFLVRYMPAGAGLDQLGYLLGRDFINMWAGAKLLLAGKVSALTDMQEYKHETDMLFGGMDTKSHLFSYPPSIFPLIICLGYLSYFAALAVWTAGGMAAMTATLRANNWFKISWGQVMLFLYSPVAVANYVLGQNGFFTASLFLGGLFLSEATPVLAGVLIGALTVKPHLGVILVPVLLIRRNMKCFASAAITALVLAGFSLAIWGMTPWHDYIEMSLNLQTHVITQSGGYGMMMPGLYANTLMSSATSLEEKIFWGVLQALAAIWAAYVSLRAVYKSGITPRSVLMLAMAALLITPYNFNYDMAVVIAALLVYIATSEAVSWPAFILFGMLWIVPLSVFELKLAGLPFASFMIPATLVYLEFFGRDVSGGDVGRPALKGQGGT